MRLGNFWGITAPMAIIIFGDDEGTLKELLAHSDEDTLREFMFLEEAIQQCDYVVPNVQIVSESLAPVLKVTEGRVDSLTEIENAQLMNEIFLRVLQELIKTLAGGEKKTIPNDLKGYVLDEVKGLSFSISNLRKVVRKLVKWLPEGDDGLDSVIEKYGIIKQVPNSVTVDGGKHTLTEIDKKFFQYFLDRADLIHRCVGYCTAYATEEETILGNSFFYLITGNHRKLYSIVRSLFYAIRDKRTPKYLLDTIDECKDGVAKYKKCIEKYVNVDEGAEIGMNNATGLKLIDGKSTECGLFFEKLLENGLLDLEYVSEKELVNLVTVVSAVCQFCKDGFTEICGSRMIGDAYKSLNEIGICGINDYQAELLFDSIGNNVFNEVINISKTSTELDEINHDLSDIDALLDTLIPIGRRIA